MTVKIEKNILGKSLLSVSKAGMGVLPIGPAQLNLTVNQGKDIIKYAFSQGINFFDTAEYYNTGAYLKKALHELSLEGIDRDEYVISSKSLSSTYDGMCQSIENQLDDLGLNYIDIFLMHEVRTGQLEERADAFEALKDYKKRGLIRAIGLSTHHINIVDNISYNPDFDVVFPLINFKGMGIRKGYVKNGTIYDSFGTPEEMSMAIHKCASNNIGVFTMKALGGGNLAQDYQKAINYIVSNRDITSLMLGFGNKKEIDDIVNLLNNNLPQNYNPDISQKMVRVNQEDCEGCGSCIPTCGSKAISFSKENGLAQIDATKCITCGYCAYACPVRAIIMY